MEEKIMAKLTMKEFAERMPMGGAMFTRRGKLIYHGTITTREYADPYIAFVATWDSYSRRDDPDKVKIPLLQPEEDAYVIGPLNRIYTNKEGYTRFVGINFLTDKVPKK